MHCLMRFWRASPRDCHVRLHHNHSSWGGPLNSKIYTMQPPLVLSLRPVSRSVPALSNAVPLLAEGLSVSDAMGSEADLWGI